jgi:pimeloyl-ACP methyl ester carboxylesterase
MGEIKCVPTGFKPSLAAELGNLVVAAYDQFKTPSGRPSKWPLTAPYEPLVEFSAAPPAHGVEKFGFVARRTDTGSVYVVFRGTQTPGDWLANIDFLQTDQPPGWGKAERGFAGVYRGTAPAILSALRSAGTPARVFVTGHSLGGALATLCVADLRATLGVAATLYAFASPRTGDPAFADHFNAECPDTWRIVNTEDIVNTVPLAATAVAELRLSGLDSVARRLEDLPLIGPTVKDHLGRVRSVFDGANYEHVGTPVDFTQHNGTIVDNHEMETYLTALGVKIDTLLAQTAAASGS